jgi:hypothetical protein
MIVRRYVFLMALTIAILAAAVLAFPVLAHQPFFEEDDITPNAPWEITDPTVSTAIYATLGTSNDVDYYAFEGNAGDVILLAMTIPQIEGQDDFAPTMALFGPGLPDLDAPSRVVRPANEGALLLPPPPGPATEFFEPFSQTSYWERQEQRVSLPADGDYVVAVWHDGGDVGRYVFVIGDKERLGGDPAFPLKMKSYWTPLPASEDERSTGDYACQPGRD